MIKLSPEMLVSRETATPNAVAILSAWVWSQLVRLAPEWVSLNRRLIVVRVCAGITFVVVLPVSIVTTARLEASKCSVP